MAKGRGGRTERELHWREQVAGWSGSGQSIRGYCRAHGLSEASFHAWRRELRRRDAQGIGLGAGSFVEVTAAGDGHTEGALEVCVSSGRTVRVHRGFDEATLAAVVRVLEGLPSKAETC